MPRTAFQTPLPPFYPLRFAHHQKPVALPTTPRPIVLITDAWTPQINGVTTTMTNLVRVLKERQLPMKVITPEGFRQIPCPGYPQISVAVAPAKRVNALLQDINPQSVFIMTEGPLGWAGRNYCNKNKIPYVTSYTTKYPEYLKKMFHLPTAFSYAILRRFHNTANGVMVATQSLKQELEQHGFRNLLLWTRGVNQAEIGPQYRDELFRPEAKTSVAKSNAAVTRPDTPQRPYLLYVGRVSEEKNLEAFLKLDLQKDVGLPPGKGTKIVVGDGPQLQSLMQKYPNAIYTGFKSGAEKSRYFASSDVFVFPSKTETFGVVILEALASGLPVAAHPATGSSDILGDHPQAGVLDQDLGKAIRNALDLKREDTIALGRQYTWERCADLWLQNMAFATGTNIQNQAKADS